MKLNRDTSPEEDYLDGEPEDEIEDDGLDDDSLYGDDLTDDYLDGEGQSPLDKHKDLLKSLTNFDPYLKDTLNNWLGLTWDENKETYVRNPLLQPIMNLNGASWCIGMLKTYTRDNNIITDISSEEYKNMMGDIIESVWLNLGTRDELGIKKDGDLLRVANEIEHAAALVLMGAGDGRYNKMLGTTFSQHTNISTPQGGSFNQQPGVQIKTDNSTLGKIKRALLGREAQ